MVIHSYSEGMLLSNTVSTEFGNKLIAESEACGKNWIYGLGWKALAECYKHPDDGIFYVTP